MLSLFEDSLFIIEDWVIPSLKKLVKCLCLFNFNGTINVLSLTLNFWALPTNFAVRMLCDLSSKG